MQNVELQSKSKIYSSQSNKFLLSSIPDDADKILDLGCGAGFNAAALMREGRVIHGVTISAQEAELAKKHCERVWVHDLESGLPSEISENYKVVLASHVLEHICYPRRILEDVRRVLAPGGTVLIVLPNPLFLRYRLRLLFGDFRYEGEGIYDYTHFRWYSYRSACELIESHGFKVQAKSVQGFIPVGPLRKFIPKKIMQTADKIACRCLPGVFGYQMKFVARV